MDTSDFPLACELLDEIVAFLLKCGGPYQYTTPRMEKLIMYSVATNQVFIKRVNDEIVWVVCWVRIKHNDIDGLVDVTPENHVFPHEMISGNVIYGHNFASSIKGGVNDMRRAVQALPHTMIILRRHGRLKHHPNHRGGL